MMNLLLVAMIFCTPAFAQHYTYHHPTWTDIDTAIKVKSQRTHADKWTDLELACDYNLLLRKYLHDTSGVDIEIIWIKPDSLYINYTCGGKSVSINQSSEDCRGRDDFVLFAYRFHYSNHLKKDYKHHDKFYSLSGWSISQEDPDSVLIFQHYKDGKENGRHVEFYPDGQVAVDGQYRVDSIGLIKSTQQSINEFTLEEESHISDGSDSKKSGFWLYYDRSGNGIRREEY